MDLLYSRYASPMELMCIYIDQGRFGEFVSEVIRMNEERKHEESEKEEDNKLWLAYLMSICEGELAFLVDSIQRPYDFMSGDNHTTVSDLFTYYITNHNAQVESEHQFKVGNITVSDPNNYIVRSDSTYMNTWDSINKKLIEPLGGYLFVRHETDGNYIDYLSDFNLISNQKIEFGKNLIDISRIVKGEDIATAIIPLGAKLEDSEERLTIKSVNNGIDYLYNEEAVSKYGWIFKTVVYDDVTDATNLKSKGNVALGEAVNLSNSIELSAVDLAVLEKNINAFHLGTYIKVVSNPHNINANFLVSKLSINLVNPAANKLTLGKSFSSFTEKKQNTQKGDKGDKGEKGDTGATGAKGDPGKDAAIKSESEPTDKTYMWLDISQTPPILKSYNALTGTWDVVSDMGEVGEAIKLTEQKFDSSIQTASNNILMSVNERYYLKEDTDALISQLQTTLEQTSTGFEMQFNQFQQNLQDVINGTDAQFTEISKYIRFEDGNIILGETGNELILKIENDRISFMQNNNEVAYFTNKKLYVTDGEYTNSLQLGKFAFIPRTTGNLSFKKVID